MPVCKSDTSTSWLRQYSRHYTATGRDLREPSPKATYALFPALRFYLPLLFIHANKAFGSSCASLIGTFGVGPCASLIHATRAGPPVPLLDMYRVFADSVASLIRATLTCGSGASSSGAAFFTLPTVLPLIYSIILFLSYCLSSSIGRLSAPLSLVSSLFGSLFLSTSCSCFLKVSIAHDLRLPQHY